MPFQFSISHPTWEAKPKIQEISEQFLKTHGFSYFQYLRCYKDGSIGLLTNNTSLSEYFSQLEIETHAVFSSMEEEQENAHAFWFMWDESLPEFPVRIAREKFNICNGVTYVRRQKDYYDMIAFALPNNLGNPGAFYLNKLAAMKQFILDFDTQNKDLIQLMDKHPIALPVEYRDANYQRLCLVDGKMVVQGKFGPSFITAQELACLRLLAEDYTHKSIAQDLEISSRTVETYLARIKERTGFTTSKEIIQLVRD